MIVEARHINVLHIASGDLWAGAEAQLFTLAKALQNIPDVSVAVLLLNHGELQQKLCDAGLEVTVLDESELNGFQILRQLVTKVREIQPDVIHTHRSKENILGSIAARLCGNVPTLRTMHGAPEHRPPWYHIPKRLIIFMDWFCGRYLQHKIIAVSEDLAEILQKDFPAKKIKVIENGVDSARIIQTAIPLKADSAAAENRFRVGIAGRLVPVKRVDLFIQTAADLMNMQPHLNTSFHIFGDGPLRSDLEALSRNLKVANIVHFEGHCNDVQSALIHLDALLITSEHEGLPMILLEAMTLRIPIIAHAVGGIPTVLNHGDCGILVADQRPSAYACAIQNLIRSPASRKTRTDKAYHRVKSRYSSETNANSYYETYRQLLD